MVSKEFIERHVNLLQRIHMSAHAWDEKTLAKMVYDIVIAEHNYWSTLPAGESREWRTYIRDHTNPPTREQVQFHTGRWSNGIPQVDTRGGSFARYGPTYDHTVFEPKHRDPVSGKLVPDFVEGHHREPYQSNEQSIADAVRMDAIKENKIRTGAVRCLCPLNFVHMKNVHDEFQKAVNKGLVPSKYYGGIGQGC